MRENIIKSIFSIVALLGYAFAWEASVLAGASIDGIQIGMTASDVNSIKGQPTSIGPEDFYKEYWLYREGDSIYSNVMVGFVPNKTRVRGLRGPELQLEDGTVLGKVDVDLLRNKLGKESRVIQNSDGEGCHTYVWAKTNIELRVVATSSGVAWYYSLFVPK